ncbi:MAG: glycosyltransferase family 2 protein [Deltaproteobacteria bacterium]|nr:glycosyltransferase family 2 protein [Deltaproteobacteria bacterium]
MHLEMKLSLSLVTFNSGPLIEDLFTSLLDTGTYQLISEIVLVDNASTDSTCDVAGNFTSRLPNMRIIQNRENIGFGAAHNQAISQVKSHCHVICNPDIKFKNANLKSLMNYLVSHSQIGLAAPKVVFPNGNLQHLNRRYPTIVDLGVQRLGKFLPKSVLESRTNKYLMKDCDYDRELDVSCLSGCFLVGKTELLKRLGGFDSSYFLYFEDFDLCQRVQREGFRTIYYPGFEVEHRWARNSHKNWIHTWYFVTSAIKFFNRWGWKVF